MIEAYLPEVSHWRGVERDEMEAVAGGAVIRGRGRLGSGHIQLQDLGVEPRALGDSDHMRKEAQAHGSTRMAIADSV